ncbi:Uncharacterised protein (plasmid) [Tsukamurella tyrosinosolvens]|uniref:Uncharacterized protein n=1 Tax=Tsukamurella tyrosinosolvens TaxID=57704 RepID=A0A1H4UF08_TSUTY|nr:hypothetical protein AXK58_13805 [Tsukamurella tyrosinosolvens]SEC67245.1 hypothetical protein SAMN04489793_2877 [Tsukamurella tyrosinosolvens]VEH94175.1 Uncharacterised protein [Tsukamurella tyrosinosolvens]
MSVLELRAHARVMNRYRRWIDRDNTRISRAGHLIAILGSTTPLWIVCGTVIVVLGDLAGLWILVPATLLAPATVWLFLAQCTHIGWDGGAR